MTSADTAREARSGTGVRVGTELSSRWDRRPSRLADLRDGLWRLGVRLMERAAGYRRGDRMEFDIRASARDLVHRGRTVSEDVGAWAQEAPRRGRKLLNEHLGED